MTQPKVPVDRKKLGKRNKNAGKDYERKKRTEDLLPIYPNAITTRLGSRERDAQGIEFMNRDEHVHGRLPWNIQCKNTAAKSFNYVLILEKIPKLPGIINVVWRKLVGRSKQGKGECFTTQGEYAFMHQRDFVTLMHYYEAVNVIKKNMEKHPVVRAELKAALEKAGVRIPID